MHVTALHGMHGTLQVPACGTAHFVVRLPWNFSIGLARLRTINKDAGGEPGQERLKLVSQRTIHNTCVPGMGNRTHSITYLILSCEFRRKYGTVQTMFFLKS